MSFRTAAAAAECAVSSSRARGARAGLVRNRSVLTIPPADGRQAAGHSRAHRARTRWGKEDRCQSFGTIGTGRGDGGTGRLGRADKDDPDGLHHLSLTASQGSTTALHKSLPYDPARDFIHVECSALQPRVMGAAPPKGWTSVAERVTREGRARRVEL